MIKTAKLLFKIVLPWLMLVFVTPGYAQLASDRPLEKVRLQLKWKHQFQFAGFYAALKQGYYAEAGFDVEILPVNFQRSASEVVLSGDAEFGVADSSLVLSRMQGRPVVILAALFQHSPLVLLSKQSSNILSPLELVGKQVMYQRNIDDAVLTAMFTEVGLTEDQYTHVPHNFKDDALINGEVDVMSAYITDQTFYFKSKNIPINIISPSNYGIDFYGDMLFTHEDYLLANKEAVLRFREASLRGWDYAINHPQDMVDWIINNLATEKTREHLLFEAENTLRLIKPKLVELGYFSVNRFDRISDIYIQLGLADKTQSTKGIDYREYYRDQPNLQWLYLLLAVLLITVLVVIGLWIYNHRLKIQVVLRSDALDSARTELGFYLEVVDRYVINSVMDEDGRLTRVSRAFCKASGYSSEQLIGRHFEELVHISQKNEVHKAIHSTLANRGRWSGEVLMRHKEQGNFWLFMELEALIDTQGKLAGLMEISINISDKKRIEELSFIDPLTDVYNRRGIQDAFNKVLSQAARYKKDLSVVIFDIDYFKKINDNYGHIQGDKVIKSIADIMRDNVRGADIPGRWGGEEFLIICPETSLAGAYALAEKLRRKIASHEFCDLPPQSCSFGVAQWLENDTYESLIARADGYLYRAKERGRNCTEGEVG
ncbi:ABC transporter substrate-binding protein [Dasania sp. GY-MA-18]|uniref:diguanylate cyclase n=1 Tax=Dasania phycosphaerae TaxID=2950436 RepID=A0A9J6RLA3_9GAMM|nr:MULTISPECIES: ABC transporter substrate-binding protein [Dasania]MCR8922844.1 ABC transporter substrate-binding protein [Dasania sp. GY-MA-18]MCZ0865275.1 ABC transporter substrate-binding protein [Dasania phycosphaerae]MCZ0869000.1 ABC transporter substrate-binding protein [Dasania phycosphaerae]